MTGVSIVGVGFTPVARKTERTVGSLALEAALNAIDDAGLRPGDIDGYAGRVDGVGEAAELIVQGTGIRPRWTTESAHGLIADSVVNTIHAIRAGTITYGLIVRAMFNPVGIRYAETTAIHTRAAQFTAPYGMHPIAEMGLLLRRYFHRYGATKADLYHVAKTLRDHAQRNPYAYWRGKPLTETDYLGARAIFEPIGLLDCDIPVTGAGAVILTTPDRAAHLRHRPAHIAGFATAWEGNREALRKAGVAASDVGCAQLYDGYLPAIWYWLEELGFCGEGEAFAFARDGNIGLGGRLPVTTFGGSTGEGRLHGIGHLREGALQVMGRAGERQVPNAQHCVVALGIEFVPGTTFVLSAG